MKLRNILPWLTASFLIGSAQAALVESYDATTDILTLSGASVVNLDLTAYETYDDTGNGNSATEPVVKILIDGITSGYMAAGTQNITKPIEVGAGGFTLNNGYSNGSYTFTGALTGSGTIAINSSSPTHTFVFAGDNTAFTGNFSIGSSNSGTTLKFGNGGAAPVGSVTGSGSITSNRNLTFNYTGDPTCSSNISGSCAIIWEGTGTITFDGVVANTGTNTTPNGGTIDIVTPQTYLSSTATQIYAVLEPTTSAPGQQLIGLQVVMAGTVSPQNLTQFTLNISNSSKTSALNVYSTGGSPTFATTTSIFSGTASEGSQVIDVTDTALVDGTNYFWVTVDVANTVVKGDVIDASCTSLTVTEGAQTPTVTAPNGELKCPADLPVKGMNYGATGVYGTGSDIYVWGFDTDYLTDDIDADSNTDWNSAGASVPASSGGEITVANDQIIRADNGTTFFRSNSYNSGNTAFSFQVRVKANGTSSGNYSANWGYIGSDSVATNGSTFLVADSQVQIGDQIVATDSNLTYNTFRYAYVPSGNNDGFGYAYIYRNDQQLKVAVVNGVASQGWWGDWGSNLGGGYTMDYIAMTAGSFSPDPAMTPVVGLDITVNGSVMTWTAEQEIGVAEYQVQQLVDGVWTTVEVLTAGAVSYESLINPAYDVRLVVVDQSGFYQSFLPDLAGQARQIYTLNAGWNLLSLPLADADLTDLLDAVDGLPMTWNGQAYEIAEALNAGEAFFVYASEAAEVTVSGTRTVEPLVLTTGWNLAGVTENQQAPLEASIIYTLDSSYDEVTADDLLLEGVGYWIYAD